LAFCDVVLCMAAMFEEVVFCCRSSV
jgi:hypothetical protein